MKFRPRTIELALALACMAAIACASGDVPDEPEPGGRPALKLTVSLRQGSRKIALRDGMTVNLARKPFDIHFLARDHGVDTGRCDALAVAARETDITGEKLIGRRRTNTRAFVNGGEAAAHNDRAQSWLILSPYAFASVYYCDAGDRRVDFVESWNERVMELRFTIRELLVDDPELARPMRKVRPRRFPPRVYCIFFMDLNDNGIMDADEFMRVVLHFKGP